MEQLGTFINSVINMEFVSLPFILKVVEALIIIIIFKVFSPLFSIIILRLFRVKKSKAEIKETKYYKTIKTFFVVLGVYIATMGLGFSDEIFVRITKLFRIVIILLVASIIANLVDGDSKFIKTLQLKLINKEDNKVMNFIGKILKTLVYIVAVFIIMKEIGYDLSGLIAGLGLRKCSVCTCCSRFG